MQIPKLNKVGECSVCKQTIHIPGGYFHMPGLHQFKGERCSGVNCSADNVRSIIAAENEALSAAKFIQEDDGYSCLIMFGLHSISCADGRTCQLARHDLARALATYYIEGFATKTVKTT